MLRIIASLALAVATLATTSIAALAQNRFALVIGNSQYKGVSPLANPIRDANAVSALLKEAGFEVTSALDLDKSSMSRAIRAFTAQVGGKPENSVALVYYAGHGVQVDGENFLVPVDAAIAREADVPLEALRLADVMGMLDAVRSKTRIVILDACRDNPFREIAKTAPRGLALVNAPAGTLVAYSTSPGATAEDGTGANSPFAVALLKSAKEPGLPIESALKNIRLAVHGATGGKQTPWEISSLTEPFSFFPGKAAVQPVSSAGKNAETLRKELQAMAPRDAFATAIREDNVTVYEQYLAVYGFDALAPDVRSIFDRRQIMVAWLEAVTLNTPAAFAAFLARYPDTDLTATAKRLEQRARARSAMALATPSVLGLSANALNNQPEIRTVIREVKVPSPPEIRTVVKEVVREVKVPSPPEIRTVTKEVVKEVKVPHEVVKVVHVPGPTRACSCGGPGPVIRSGPGPRPPVIRTGHGPRVQHGPRVHGGGRGVVRVNVGGPRGPHINRTGPRMPQAHGGGRGGNRNKFRF